MRINKRNVIFSALTLIFTSFASQPVLADDYSDTGESTVQIEFTGGVELKGVPNFDFGSNNTILDNEDFDLANGASGTDATNTRYMGVHDQGGNDSGWKLKMTLGNFYAKNGTGVDTSKTLGSDVSLTLPQPVAPNSGNDTGVFGYISDTDDITASNMKSLTSSQKAYAGDGSGNDVSLVAGDATKGTGTVMGVDDGSMASTYTIWGFPNTKSAKLSVPFNDQKQGTWVSEMDWNLATTAA